MAVGAGRVSGASWLAAFGVFWFFGCGIGGTVSAGGNTGKSSIAGATEVVPDSVGFGVRIGDAFAGVFRSIDGVSTVVSVGDGTCGNAVAAGCG